MNTLARLVAGLAGVGLVGATLAAALKTVVVPRAYSPLLTRLHFGLVRLVFLAAARPSLPFERRDRVMALYAPAALVLLPGLWVALVVVGFTALFWATNIRPLAEAFATSGSSLLTLGFDRPGDTPHVALAFLEAAIGLGLVSLLISYLPTIYGAFSRREAMVGMLEVRAGLPPSPAELLARFTRIGWLNRLPDDLFAPWEAWFTDIEESHISHPSLVFFRSPHPERSWITAAGCVLDTAALYQSTIDVPHDARGDVMLRGGFLALRRVADSFGLHYQPDPAPTDPISVSRREFDELYEELRAAGVPVRADAEEAWRSFCGWRVNYDEVLIALCTLVMAPPARWSSDRPTQARHWHVVLPSLRRPAPLRRTADRFPGPGPGSGSGATPRR